MTGIEVETVSKVFGPRPETVLPMLADGFDKGEILARTGHVIGLRDVSLSMDAGMIHVVMGLSGSGKSTLIRHFNRLIDPTAGVIRIGGENILTLAPGALRHLRQTRISMVFQHFGLMPHRTVLGNVCYGLEVRGEDRTQREATARRWIARVGLEGYEDAYPCMLSGGMQQRVGLARGLATDPDILLMDEAFSALDPLIRNDMQGILLDLQGELRKTIVFITHDLDEALAIGDRIAILHDGEMVQVGAPPDIILRPANNYVRRFVAQVNRGRALIVGAIMAPIRDPPGTGATVAACDTLEAALASVVGQAPHATVLDAAGAPCGTITARDIVSAVSGQSGEPQ